MMRAALMPRLVRKRANLRLKHGMIRSSPASSGSTRGSIRTHTASIEVDLRAGIGCLDRPDHDGGELIQLRSIPGPMAMQLIRSRSSASVLHQISWTHCLAASRQSGRPWRHLP